MTPNPPDPSSLIQHRAPILCVDRILEANSERVLAEFDVIDGPHLDGGVMWEQSLLEGLAQSAAVLQSEPDSKESDRVELEGVGMLVGVRKFVVLRQPQVGECVRWCVELIKRLGPFMLTNCHAECDGEVVARGELKFYWEVSP